MSSLSISIQDFEKTAPVDPSSLPRFRKGVYMSSMVAAVGGFISGYDTGAVSGILTMPLFQTGFFSPDTMSYLQGLLLALFLMTGAIGGFISGFFCDRFSRKWTIIASATLFCIGNLFEVIGYDYGLLLAGRLVAGLGCGLFTNAIPLYHSEIAPPDIRGRLISFFSLMVFFGQVVGYFVAFGTSYLTTDWSWRAPWLLQLLVCAIFAISVVPFPYSPRWLIDKGRHEEALKSLTFLRELPADHPIVRNEYEEIRSELEFERSLGKRTYAELFARGNRKRFAATAFIGIASAMTGNTAIWYYAPQTFMSAGLNSASSGIAATGGTGILSFVAAAISLQWCIDTWGRKTLFLGGSVLMTISMFVVGAMFYVYANVDVESGVVHVSNDNARNTILAFIYMFTASYASTWSLASFVYPAEILNMRTRAKGIAIGYGLNWAFSILVTYCVPLFMATTVSGVYFFFGACCLVAIPGILVLPETKGKTLEQMEYVFGAK